jgi:phosphoribosyl 1,2-cyclic phosphate phosphodiesterase
LLDGCVLIDCTVGGLDRLRRSGTELCVVSDVFFTHSHRDHFDPAALEELAALRRDRPLRVWADGALGAQLAHLPLCFTALQVGQAIQTGFWSVLPLRANHIVTLPGEQQLHFLFTGPVNVFYATDGAWLLPDTVQALQGSPLDAIVFDATIGDGHEGDYRIFEHNNLNMVREMAATLRATGVLKPGAPALLTHLARTLRPDHAAVQAAMGPRFVVAYDGMEIELGF